MRSRLCRSFRVGELRSTCYGCSFLSDCHPKIERRKSVLLKLNYRVWWWRLTSLSFLLFNIALTVALATIWGGSAMNPQYLFCAETNRYGEFWIETVLISAAPGTMLLLGWKATR